MVVPMIHESKPVVVVVKVVSMYNYMDNSLDNNLVDNMVLVVGNIVVLVGVGNNMVVVVVVGNNMVVAVVAFYVMCGLNFYDRR